MVMEVEEEDWGDAAADIPVLAKLVIHGGVFTRVRIVPPPASSERVL